MSNQVISTILESFDVEMARLLISNETKAAVVGEMVIREYLLANCHVFLTPVNLHAITDEILTSVILRDFILELTDRVTVTLAAQGLNLDEYVSIIATAIGYSRNPKEGLMVKEVMDSISVDTDLLAVVLRNNPWLIIMYTLKMFVHSTEYYKATLSRME